MEQMPLNVNEPRAHSLPMPNRTLRLHISGLALHKSLLAEMIGAIALQHLQVFGTVRFRVHSVQIVRMMEAFRANLLDNREYRVQ